MKYSKKGKKATMIENAERFLTAYAEIESLLRSITHQDEYIPFMQLVKRSEKQISFISEYYNDLREYAELRNAIVHLRDGQTEVIAYPSEKTVTKIEAIVRILQESRHKALPIATTPVITVTPETKIIDAYYKMKNMHTSKLPVYRGNRYEGILTIETILEWKLFDTQQKTLVGDIVRQGNKHEVVFMNENTSRDNVVMAFQKSLKNGNVLSAVIITKSGNMNEKPAGIVTVQDLPRFTLY